MSITRPASSYLARRGTPTTLQELEGHDIVSILDRPIPLRSPQGTETIDLRPSIVANEFGFLRTLLLERIGIGLVLDGPVRADLSSGALIRVLPDHFLDGGVVNAVFPSRRVPPKVRVFVDFLVERARDTSVFYR